MALSGEILTSCAEWMGMFVAVSYGASVISVLLWRSQTRVGESSWGEQVDVLLWHVRHLIFCTYINPYELVNSIDMWGIFGMLYHIATSVQIPLYYTGDTFLLRCCYHEKSRDYSRRNEKRLKKIRTHIFLLQKWAYVLLCRIDQKHAQLESKCTVVDLYCSCKSLL